MKSNFVSTALGIAAIGAIGAHVAATALQNTPDSYNLDMRPYVGGWTVPGWRFFAPNPGNQNVHVLVRTRDVEGTQVSDWKDVTPPVHHSVFNVLINPRSRGPKALFDAMQQLTVMRDNYAGLDWIFKSLPYELVADTCRGLIQDAVGPQFQYLLMNYVPSASEGERMQPILVSQWLAVNTEGVRG
ncbi:hypothetical protein BAURA86_00574 [Brevibacterium aurantiacum]|uniref:Uncharacterized protein n=1 Tax=Brevibacterium aurantiacum TaxID=273384 RepID=A0A2H1IFJ7_BREAU|nr:DUF5819 family protein [Brevibacterium aurantiacum]SMX73782.1 hypothetical protein BAURA86_00574 [Brevibacterium aurantiacum]